jgi:hypothetical protein
LFGSTNPTAAITAGVRNPSARIIILPGPIAVNAYNY